MKIKLAVFLFIGVSLPAAADDRWAYIGSSGGTKTYVDTKTIKIKSGSVNVWVKHSRKAGKSIINEDIDCVNKTLMVNDITEYGKTGKIEYSKNYTGQLSGIGGRMPSKVVPDSIGEAVVEFSCNLTASQTSSYNPLIEAHNSFIKDYGIPP